MSADFERTGLRGGLNYCRNIDRNWELLAPWTGAADKTPLKAMKPRCQTCSVRF